MIWIIHNVIQCFSNVLSETYVLTNIGMSIIKNTNKQYLAQYPRVIHVIVVIVVR